MRPTRIHLARPHPTPFEGGESIPGERSRLPVERKQTLKAPGRTGLGQPGVGAMVFPPASPRVESPRPRTAGNPHPQGIPSQEVEVQPGGAETQDPVPRGKGQKGPKKDQEQESQEAFPPRPSLGRFLQGFLHTGTWTFPPPRSGTFLLVQESRGFKDPFVPFPPGRRLQEKKVGFISPWPGPSS